MGIETRILDGWLIAEHRDGSRDARNTMLRDIADYGVRSFDLSNLTDQQVFELWSLVTASRELWQHAQPHHHREVATVIYHGKVSLWT